MGIVIWNLEGRLIEANEAFLHLVEYSRENLLSGRVRWTELTPPEWRDADERAIAELKASGTFQPYEKEYFRKDGSRVPVLIGGASFEGKGTEGVAFVLDLSERKQAEEALRRSEAYLAEAQRLSGTGSWARTPATGEIRYLSEECYRVLGFDPQGGMQTSETFFQRIHPNDRARTIESVERATREKAEFEIDYRIVHPGGEIRDIHSVGHPVFSPSGDLVEFVGTVIDVTERKRAENALNKAQVELAHVTRITTMGELTASIAHEVNQPLAAVVTNGNACLRWLAADPPNFDEARDAVRRIVRDGNRASDVIARIRSLVKKSGSVAARLDMNSTVREILALTQSEVDRRGASLQTDLAADLPAVTGDRVQLQQVLLNLIINALDAMSALTDRPRVIRVRTRATESKSILVAVEDSGVGLDPEQAARLFDAFYTTKVEGLGMGLSISRSIVEAHGGRLWATANQGPGATFQFTLPIEEEAGVNPPEWTPENR